MAGIAVFVFAMSLVETSLKNVAGRPFKKFLQRQSKSKVKMIAASTVVTAILQSSSVVLLMVLSFVGAGILGMRGALAAVLGSNLGTTLDSWVIAYVGFKIDFAAISYPLLSVSLIGLFFFKKKSTFYHLTLFIIGFAFIFISLEWLKTSADKSLENSLSFFHNWHYLTFIPIGFVITAVIQSSLATMAMTLTALFNHLIPIEGAAAVVIGSELGTTLKFLVGSAGGIPDKKRVAWGNFFLNLITMVIAAILLKPIIYLIQHVIVISDPLLALVLFQSSINLLAIILFYPFLRVCADFLERFFKESLSENLTAYIGKTTAALPGDAVELAEKETIHLINETVELNKRGLGLKEKEKEKTGWMFSIKKYASDSSSYDETYHKMKILQGEILEYITTISKDEMNEREAMQSGKLIHITRHVLRSAKNLKDIRHNLEEYETTANDSLYGIFSLVRENAREFYSKFQTLLQEPEKVNTEAIEKLTKWNRNQYDDAIAGMLSALQHKKVSDLDSSTLLNVFHEVYASNKALVRALADLKDLEAED